MPYLSPMVNVSKKFQSLVSLTPLWNRNSKTEIQIRHCLEDLLKIGLLLIYMAWPSPSNAAKLNNAKDRLACKNTFCIHIEGCSSNDE